MSSFNTPPSDSHYFDDADESTQLEILFSLLNVKEDSPEYELSQQLKTKLDKMTKDNVKYIVMTSGEYKGERRQIYKDRNGFPYYKSGMFFFLMFTIFLIHFFYRKEKD